METLPLQQPWCLNSYLAWGLEASLSLPQMCIPYNKPNAFEHFHPILPMVVEWPKHLEISIILHTTSFSSRFSRPISIESNNFFFTFIITKGHYGINKWQKLGRVDGLTSFLQG
jgi:hypothetical protein